MNTVHVCSVIDGVMKKAGYVKRVLPHHKGVLVQYVRDDLVVPQELVLAVVNELELESLRLP